MQGCREGEESGHDQKTTEIRGNEPEISSRFRRGKDMARWGALAPPSSQPVESPGLKQSAFPCASRQWPHAAGNSLISDAFVPFTPDEIIPFFVADTKPDGLAQGPTPGGVAVAGVAQGLPRPDSQPQPLTLTHNRTSHGEEEGPCEANRRIESCDAGGCVKDCLLASTLRPSRPG